MIWSTLWNVMAVVGCLFSFEVLVLLILAIIKNRKGE